MSGIKFYLQVDYIDKDGFCNLVDTFNLEDIVKAKEYVEDLMQHTTCYSIDEGYVLDLHACIICDDEEIDGTDTKVLSILPEYTLLV